MPLPNSFFSLDLLDYNFFPSRDAFFIKLIGPNVLPFDPLTSLNFFISNGDFLEALDYCFESEPVTLFVLRSSLFQLRDISDSYLL